VALFLLNGLLLTSAFPQGAPNPADQYPAQTPGQGQNPPGAQSPSDLSVTNTSPVGPPGGDGIRGGNLKVDCKPKETSPGKFTFVCDGVDKESISLRSEHVLWLSSAGGQQQIVDIEIPNYKIEELIKAGFKNQPGQGSLINLLLKKPEQSYDAQVEAVPQAGGTPTVSLNYEPVQKSLVHFPNDKPYSPLTGPILPPLAGGRPQRQVGRRISKPQPSYSVQLSSQN